MSGTLLDCIKNVSVMFIKDGDNYKKDQIGIVINYDENCVMPLKIRINEQTVINCKWSDVILSNSDQIIIERLKQIFNQMQTIDENYQAVVKRDLNRGNGLKKRGGYTF